MGGGGQENRPPATCKAGSTVTRLKVSAQQQANGSGGRASFPHGTESWGLLFLILTCFCSPHSVEARSMAGTSLCLHHVLATVSAGTHPALSALSATSSWWI